ncbi:unnamed protein product [Prorocentrum cordatum]|uniref:ISXO2-like transposase domain-containing protein n=1 Tax=Prorocentrum cordatum TaxID=2364126 RepID=A0ABN9R1K1_9DINO|nr:unnamed protein product [Polarella glacialis]
MPNFPLPKKGKRRAASQNQSVKKVKKRIPYVRHGIRTVKSRNERMKWRAGLSDFMNKGQKHVIDVLKKHGHLPEWAGANCPLCTKGTLGKLQKWSDKQGGWGHRCNHSGCHRHVLPRAFHPIFVAGTGQSHAPLRDQASALFSAVAGASQVCTGRLVQNNHKMVEGICGRLYAARERYVAAKEKSIQFGQGEAWKDIEADEVDLAKKVSEDGGSSPVDWEQWGGILERGAPDALVLFRLRPVKTKKRAPGPGAIRKRDGMPAAKKWLKGRRVILHADGAKSYRVKLDGVKHDYVVHCRKRVNVNGKRIWARPKYAKPRFHNIAEDGAPTQKLWVMAGTQVIDRCWHGLRKHLGSVKVVNTKLLRQKIRSFQWEYWNRGADYWQRTGDMLIDLWHKDFGK